MVPFYTPSDWLHPDSAGLACYPATETSLIVNWPLLPFQKLSTPRRYNMPGLGVLSPNAERRRPEHASLFMLLHYSSPIRGFGETSSLPISTPKARVPIGLILDTAQSEMMMRAKRGNSLKIRQCQVRNPSEGRGERHGCSGAGLIGILPSGIFRATTTTSLNSSFAMGSVARQRGHWNWNQ